MNAIRKVMMITKLTCQLISCAVMTVCLLVMVTGWKHNLATGMDSHSAMTYCWRPFVAMFN